MRYLKSVFSYSILNNFSSNLEGKYLKYAIIKDGLKSLLKYIAHSSLDRYSLIEQSPCSEIL